MNEFGSYIFLSALHRNECPNQSFVFEEFSKCSKDEQDDFIEFLKSFDIPEGEVKNG